ncbi:MAG: RNA polymerase sigma factor 70 region 4 type 2 domain-containing protein [uncultured Clostridium sp.]
MARKTVKGLEEIIAGLENKLNEYMKLINDRNKQIEQMENIANDKFENSPDYRRMKKEIKGLETIIESHEITIKQKEDSIKSKMYTIEYISKENFELKLENNKLKEEIEELKNINKVKKLKNERGAGRKEMFTEEQKAIAKMLRLQGKSYRAIAKDMNCSVATVHKIINEQQC